MVRRRMLFGAATILALAGARPAAAGSINFATGNVEKDMPSSTPGLVTIVNRQTPSTGRAVPQQLAYMTSEGKVNGWVVKDVRVHYDEASDQLQVGVNFFGIAGDADGNGVVGTIDPRFKGTEAAMLGFKSPTNDSHISVGIDLTGSKDPLFASIVAGISADKSKAGPGTWGFSVNKVDDYLNRNYGLGSSYGTSLNANHNGGLAFAPSANNPDFEFTITNLSKIPGFNKENGIGIRVAAGSSMDEGVGEESVPKTTISYQQITVPEPATMLAWSVVACGAAVRGLRRRRKGESSVA